MYRVIVTADLHYHLQWHEVLEAFARSVKRARPDCLVVAGDVGHPLHHFVAGLRLFADLPCLKLVLAGNHDLWTGVYHSERLWKSELALASRRYGFHWLEAESFKSGKLGICGTLGWYDYSAKDPSLGFTDRDYAVNKSQVNNDAHYLDWRWSDREFADELVAQFERRLAALHADPAVAEILVVTHVPPFEANILRKSGDPFWNFSNAYFGNLTLGKVIAACPKVRRVVSGHTHVGGTWRVPGVAGEIISYVVDSEYGRPAMIELDLEVE